MPKIVVLAYNHHPQVMSPEDWIRRIRSQAGVLEELAKYCIVVYVGHLGYQGTLVKENVQYFFLPASRLSKNFPSATHQFIRRLKPDAVIILGMHFPLQALQLGWSLPGNVKIAAQYEADRPFTGLKRIVQKLADKRINYYFFSARQDARPWIATGNIQHLEKCKEVYVGAPQFSLHDKMDSKRRVGITGDFHYLWVGRLDRNKDPLTVLAAFAKYLKVNREARLHMFYHTTELLADIKAFLNNEGISDAVVLHGFAAPEVLQYWYGAADFFISASYREGGSYALVEAIACACIPIVSNIPSSAVAIGFGEFGFLFEPGDVDGLFTALSATHAVDKVAWRAKVSEHYRTQYSAAAIAGKVSRILADNV